MNIFPRVAIMCLLFMMACKTPVKISKSPVIESQTDSVMNVSGITHTFLLDILKQHPDLFQSVLSNPDNKVQIIYTQIDRGNNGNPKFTDHYFNINDSSYFYPASTVKLPIAILALQKLNELKIAGLDKNSTMISEADYSGQTEVYNDPSTLDGRPTIEHYIKKILLVSDNDDFNRLYEFLGQEYINTKLQEMGYVNTQIIHRLSVSLTEEQNRNTNPVNFYNNEGKLVYSKPAEYSKLIYAEQNTKMGNGFYRGDQLINEPF